jgi:hypothetical protein
MVSIVRNPSKNVLHIFSTAKSKNRQITEGNSKQDFSKVFKIGNIFKIVNIFLETNSAYIEKKTMKNEGP